MQHQKTNPNKRKEVVNMKKILKTLSGVLALTLVLSSTPSITANAALDPFLLQPAKIYTYKDPMRLGVEYTVTEVEQSNHIPQRVDLTPEQIQGLVASTLSVIPEIDDPYGDGDLELSKRGLDAIPYQPMSYTSTHSCINYPNEYFSTQMVETVNYLGDYTIGGVLDPTKLVYEASAGNGYNEAGKELTRQRKAGIISYDEWLSKLGTASNGIDYQAYYRTTYNYAIIVNGQNSPTFNVGTNILAIISPLGDRMYFDVFGLDANGNVYIPDGYHYYNSLLNISYQEYKHNLGICRCTDSNAEGGQALVLARQQANRSIYIMPAEQPVYACSLQTLNLRYDSTLPKVEEEDFNKVLQKINGKRYTPVTIK